MSKIKRIAEALARQGLIVTHADKTWSVKLASSPNAPIAEVLLPDEFPVEGKALKQLAQLAAASHPSGARIDRALATPDFHPGDSGVAIGSVASSRDLVIPAAVGSDINCGMRLHVVDLTIDAFLAKRDAFVGAMKGDYFFGTRDLP